jgi:hypothetical protein
VVQVLLQTPFIIDGLRRCSNTRHLRLQKPGRELVTFLVVCNVAMWITETFEIKSHDRRDDRYDVYGKVLWTMLSHMTVPLTMFYRFHSSVCLVDIWKSAYERGEWRFILSACWNLRTSTFDKFKIWVGNLIPKYDVTTCIMLKFLSNFEQ